MRLISFLVQNYRCFLDSGPIEVDRGLTPIVGKNESGKSVLLYSLSCLSAPENPFSKLTDWPGTRSLDDFRPSLPVVSAVFQLAEDEQSRLSVKCEQVEITRRYDGLFNVDFHGIGAPLFPAEITNAAQRLSRLIAEPARSRAVGLWRPASPRSFIAAYDQFAAPTHSVNVVDPTNRPAVLELLGKIRQPTPDASQAIERMRSRSEQEQAALSSMPTFHYFDDYEILPGTLNLETWRGKPVADHAPEEKRFLLLCALADLNARAIADIPSSTREGVAQRKQLARHGSLSITNQTFPLWTQRESETSFEIDGDMLTVYITDRAGNVPVPLDSRSAGFRWFFSFYVLFAAQIQEDLLSGILLLDEPGTRLHGKAQADLVRVLRTLSSANQILYTTHSPFMLATDALDDVRVVSESTLGSVVSNSLVAYDGADAFPIQYALGFDLAQTYFGRREQLLVEGWSDYYYLSAFAEVVDDRRYLDRISILASLGAPKVPTAANYSLATGHDVRVLLDGDAAGRRVETQRAAEGVLPPPSIVLISTVEGCTTIEDIFGDSQYKKLVHDAYAIEVERHGEPKFRTDPHSTLVDRVAVAYETAGVRVSKNRVAHYFLDEVRAKRIQVAPKVRDRFKQLLDSVYAAPPHRR